ncbi:MAG TPA: hypothetical protein VK139_00095 [Microbacteriaceae bacterium]|nr:hypothetical protein [Microbacteriaceae bacterium]
MFRSTNAHAGRSTELRQRRVRDRRTWALIASVSAIAVVATALNALPRHTSIGARGSETVAQLFKATPAPSASPEVSFSHSEIQAALDGAILRKSGLIDEALPGVETATAISQTTISSSQRADLAREMAARTAPTDAAGVSTADVPEAADLEQFAGQLLDQAREQQTEEIASPGVDTDVSPSPTVESTVQTDATASESAQPVPAEVVATYDIPRDASEGLSVSRSDGLGYSIHLPGSDGASDAVRLDNGAIAYPGTGSSANAAISTLDGFQMLTVIADANAPTRYAYRIDLPSGARIELINNGAQIVTADGTVLAVVSAAWARDAKGQEIPTHFEVEGDQLVQVVDHTSVEGVAYPVTADPDFWDFITSIVGAVVSVFVAVITGNVWFASNVGSCAKYGLMELFDNNGDTQKGLEGCGSALMHNAIATVFGGGVFGQTLGGCLTMMLFSNDSQGSPFQRCREGGASMAFRYAVDSVMQSALTFQQSVMMSKYDKLFLEGQSDILTSLIYEPTWKNVLDPALKSWLDEHKSDPRTKPSDALLGWLDSNEARAIRGVLEFYQSYAEKEEKRLYDAALGFIKTGPTHGAWTKAEAAWVKIGGKSVKRPWWTIDDQSDSFKNPRNVAVAAEALWARGLASKGDLKDMVADMKADKSGKYAATVRTLETSDFWPEIQYLVNDGMPRISCTPSFEDRLRFYSLAGGPPPPTPHGIALRVTQNRIDELLWAKKRGPCSVLTNTRLPWGESEVQQRRLFYGNDAEYVTKKTCDLTDLDFKRFNDYSKAVVLWKAKPSEAKSDKIIAQTNDVLVARGKMPCSFLSRTELDPTMTEYDEMFTWTQEIPDWYLVPKVLTHKPASEQAQPPQSDLGKPYTPWLDNGTGSSTRSPATHP